MPLSSRDMLRRLGAGETIADVCAAAGLDRAQFDAWWRAEAAARVPDPAGARRAAVRRAVRIERDRWGVPSIYAEDDEDLFFGFGYAMAQDRLFQLDYLRRRGSGRLAEVLGAEGTDLDLLARVVGFKSVFELDLLARTVGLRRIAERQWAAQSGEARRLVTAFSAGVNALIDETRDRPPIEFDLLDYRPEAWSPIDCLTVAVEFAWYLTGRFPVIVIPELAKRALGDGPLYRALLEGEADDESILPPGSYPRVRRPVEPVGRSVSDPQGAEGSNNWVIAGRRSASGRPLVASDPHVPFDAVSWWYEVHLCGGSFHVAGMAYAGVPAVMFGRTEGVAWGCTNNICSQRDLYRERADPAQPGCFLYDGRWEPWRERAEVIDIKGGDPARKTIRYSRNGPVVDEVLPPPARGTGPVSLRWLGDSAASWLPALLAMDRARSAEEFREALRSWEVPTFCVVYADADGHVGYQATGRVPVRAAWERGYRPGWDPAHRWQGVIPFDGMPRLADPPRGWVATANNRVAADDFPYPLSGTWSDGHRARRVRQMIEEREGAGMARADCAAMHQDAMSPRAARAVPALLAEPALTTSPSAEVREAMRHLAAWDFRMEPDRVGAAIFDVFFSLWTKAVVRERFDGETAALLAGGAGGLAARLLEGDPPGWFRAGRRESAINETMHEAIGYLAKRLGPDVAGWTWGRLHTMPLRHVLSGRGDLGPLLDQGGLPVKGDMTTVCNTGLGAAFEARAGANYRLIADFGDPLPTLWAVDASSESGHPGSPHYRDQLEGWARGEYHALPLDREAAGKGAVARLVLEPEGGG
ncbi:MAG TPA: penicillin acylase family protein [Gemmataceae bacterium]|nr:penicillin acylase family protein [Gemmataceae bacterium]